MTSTQHPTSESSPILSSDGLDTASSAEPALKRFAGIDIVVRTDLSKAQITSLMCLANKIDREDIYSFVIGPELVTGMYATGGSFIRLPGHEDIQQYISEFYCGILNE